MVQEGEMKSVAEIAREAGLNQFEEKARQEKCIKLVRHMLSELIKITREADEDLWIATAKRAGVGIPSETSRKRVIEILEGIRII